MVKKTEDICGACKRKQVGRNGHHSCPVVPGFTYVKIGEEKNYSYVCEQQGCEWRGRKERIMQHLKDHGVDLQKENKVLNTTHGPTSKHEPQLMEEIVEEENEEVNGEREEKK